MRTLTPAPAAPFSIDFDAIGARWRIETPQPLDRDLLRQVHQRIDAFDRVYSRFREDSLAQALAEAHTGGVLRLPVDAEPLLDLYDRLHTLTDGAVDPLVGRRLELLGYDAGYTLRPAADARLQADHARRPVWSRDVRRRGTALSTDRPVVLDVGAAGKGYVVDLVSDLIRAALGDLDQGATGDVVVDAGGDLRHHGPRPTRVGLEHPTLPGRVIGVVRLQDAALCASATTRRAWGPLHHVIDPRTGQPTTDVIATWVVAHTAAVADGLATALFFTEPRVLREGFDFEYARMTSHGVVDASTGLDADLFVPDAQLHLTDPLRRTT